MVHAEVNVCITGDGTFSFYLFLGFIRGGRVAATRGPGVVFSGLKIVKNARKRSNSYARPNNHGLIKVVKTLCWGTKGPVDSHIRQVFVLAKFACPVTVRLDVDLELSIRASRYRKWMPLEEGNLRHLEEEVLPCLVRPKSEFWHRRRNAHRFIVENLQFRWDFVEARQESCKPLGQY